MNLVTINRVSEITSRTVESIRTRYKRDWSFPKPIVLGDRGSRRRCVWVESSVKDWQKKYGAMSRRERLGERRMRNVGSSLAPNLRNSVLKGNSEGCLNG